MMITFGELYELYYSRHALAKNKSPENARYFFNAHGARWKDVPVESIDRGDVQSWVDELGVKSPSAATRAVNMMSAIINWGLRRGKVKGLVNPCVGVERFKVNSRERFLSVEELNRFKIACEQEKPLFRDFFLIALATGARKGNLLAMRWSDLHLNSGYWLLPGVEMKNGKSLMIPLSSDALALLHRRKREHEEETPYSAWVFPNDFTVTGHISDPSSAFHRICKRAQITNLTVHDLRRTVASHMAIQGESPYVIGGMLGHRDPRSTAAYARINLQPVRDAIENVHDLWKLAPADTKVKPLHPVLAEEAAFHANGLTIRAKVIKRILQLLMIGDKNKSELLKLIPQALAIEMEQTLRVLIERGMVERYWYKDRGKRQHFHRYRLLTENVFASLVPRNECVVQNGIAEVVDETCSH